MSFLSQIDSQTPPDLKGIDLLIIDIKGHHEARAALRRFP